MGVLRHQFRAQAQLCGKTEATVMLARIESTQTMADANGPAPLPQFEGGGPTVLVKNTFIDFEDDSLTNDLRRLVTCPPDLSCLKSHSGDPASDLSDIETSSHISEECSWHMPAPSTPLARQWPGSNSSDGYADSDAASMSQMESQPAVIMNSDDAPQCSLAAPGAATLLADTHVKQQTDDELWEQMGWHGYGYYKASPRQIDATQRSVNLGGQPTQGAQPMPGRVSKIAHQMTEEELWEQMGWHGMYQMQAMHQMQQTQAMRPVQLVPVMVSRNFPSSGGGMPAISMTAPPESSFGTRYESRTLSKGSTSGSGQPASRADSTANRNQSFGSVAAAAADVPSKRNPASHGYWYGEVEESTDVRDSPGIRVVSKTHSDAPNSGADAFESLDDDGKGQDVGVPQPQTVKRTFNRSSGVYRVLWIVDARKLRGNDKQAVSPPFELFISGQQGTTFKMMIYPSSSSSAKKGACFKKALGRGYIQLKCEAELPETFAEVSYKVSIGSGAQAQEPRGSTHDFSKSAICGLPKGDDTWDFNSVVDQASMTFNVVLELVPHSPAPLMGIR